MQRNVISQPEIELIEFVISMVQQPTHNTCVSACISVVTGIATGLVVERFHDKYCSGDAEAHEIFEQEGLPYRACYSWERSLKPGKTYFLSVPSINHVAGLHMVVAQVEADCWYFVDPATGRDGTKYYDLVDSGENSVLLEAWTPVYEFSTQDIQRQYEMRGVC